MKALIGIDPGYRYWAAMNLLARLKFPKPEWHLVSANRPLAATDWSWIPSEQSLEIQLSEEALKGIHDLLSEASDAACKFGIVAEKHIGHGGAADVLLFDGDRLKVDLIAVGSREQGPVSSAFTGSVSRALTVGALQSVLIGKGTPAVSGKITAVFATDFSAYAEGCLEKLISWEPKGFEKVVLMCAYPAQEDNSRKNEVTRMLRERGTQAVARLESAGIKAGFSLRPGEVHYAIEHEMKINNADLLILGAQGHGFLERLLIGSTALHQVVGTDHSVLIMRT